MKGCSKVCKKSGAPDGAPKDKKNTEKKAYIFCNLSILPGGQGDGLCPAVAPGLRPSQRAPAIIPLQLDLGHKSHISKLVLPFGHFSTKN